MSCRCQNQRIAEAVTAERERCAKIAAHPIAKGATIPCDNPTSFADGFRAAQALIIAQIESGE